VVQACRLHLEELIFSQPTRLPQKSSLKSGQSAVRKTAFPPFSLLRCAIFSEGTGERPETPNTKKGN